MNAVPARDVVGRGHDPSALRVASDDERLGAEGWVLELLDCGEERVEIEMREDAGHVVTVDTATSVLVYRHLMIAAPPPPPPLPQPRIERPASNEVSYGVISGVAAPGSRRLIVRVDGRVLRTLTLRRRAFTFRIDPPTGEHGVRVDTIAKDGRRSVTRVANVFFLPGAAAPRQRRPQLDPILAGDLERRLRAFPGTAAAYVENLTTGFGAAWNARASFPAASTLKLAIAVTALARLEGTPAPGSRLDRLIRGTLIVSDNVASNQLEAAFGGSTSGGSVLVNAMMRSIGLVDTEMYGGYIPGTRIAPARATAARIPHRVDEQPVWGRGKRTTAYDLAVLARSVWLASGGLGPLRRAQPWFTAKDARYLLYLLAHVRDRGKLDRRLRGRPGLVVLHKAGWITAARHDNGLVVYPGGLFVACVMTHGAGTGTRSDELTGDVALTAFRRFRG